jgi:riboflavin synthase
MFTGIIQKTARVLSLVPTSGQSYRLRISHPFRTEGREDPLSMGESIAVNGVCLTVVLETSDSIEFDVSPETVERTALSRLSPGKRVNLERALRIGDRLSGHWVQGHVDGTARVVRIEAAGEGYTDLDLEFTDASTLRYVVPKGSLCIDGISLTVHRLSKNIVGFQLIPHTWNETALPELNLGDLVNFEVDILAKYLERMKAYDPTGFGN